METRGPPHEGARPPLLTPNIIRPQKTAKHAGKMPWGSHGEGEGTVSEDRHARAKVRSSMRGYVVLKFEVEDDWGVLCLSLVRGIPPGSRHRRVCLGGPHRARLGFGAVRPLAMYGGEDDR
jgi:hypothetical protein